MLTIFFNTARWSFTALKVLDIKIENEEVGE